MWKCTCLLRFCALTLKSCTSNCPSSPTIWPRSRLRITASRATSTPARTSSPRSPTSSRLLSGRISWSVFVWRTESSSSRRPWGAEWCVERLSRCVSHSSPVFYLYSPFLNFCHLAGATEPQIPGQPDTRTVSSPRQSTLWTIKCSSHCAIKICAIILYLFVTTYILVHPCILLYSILFLLYHL